MGRLTKLSAAALALAALGASPAGAAVSAYPAPGSRYASPQTQLSFRGVAPSALGRVRVEGSRSGVHQGRLRAHSDGRGASFLPRRPFRADESVLVRTSQDVVGARGGSFRLRIARPSTRTKRGDDRLPATVSPGATRSYRSRGDLRPPVVTIDQRAPATADRGLLFLSANPKQPGSRRQQGPMIVDDRGQLVWFRPLGGGRHATNVRVQRYRGRRVLTWWQGTSTQGMGTGEYVLFDEHYRLAGRVRAGNGYRGDLHEFRITPSDTALITIYQDVRRDLSSVGGPRRGLAVDSIVQEIDIATGLVLFEWHSLDSISPRESYKRPVPTSDRVPWDYAHVNSVGLTPDGNLLVSARNTWGVYKLDKARASIAWRLGGKRSDFRRGAGVRFAWQHDARWRGANLLTLFDNASSPAVRSRSRAITLALDERARTATLARSLTHPSGLLAATEGNVQVTRDGRSIVGWGSRRAFTAFAPDGRILLNGRIALGYTSYRAYRQPWAGRPVERPRVAASCGRRATTVWASWNGATGVARWELLAGPSRDRLAPAGTVAATGFETRAAAPGGARYVAARPLDAAGQAFAGPSVTRCR